MQVAQPRVPASAQGYGRRHGKNPNQRGMEIIPGFFDFHRRVHTTALRLYSETSARNAYVLGHSARNTEEGML